MEPERPIEKALRAAAKQRRERAGSDYQLHPATRRLLQNEVARQYPPLKEAPSAFRWFAQSWPRLAWSLAGVAVLAIAGAAVWLTWLPHKGQERLMARNESIEKDAEQPSASPVPMRAQNEPGQQLPAAEPMADRDAARRELGQTPSKLADETPALRQRSTVAESPPVDDTPRTRSLNSDTLAVRAPAAAAPLEAAPAKAGTPARFADKQAASSTAGIASKEELLAKSLDAVAEGAKRAPFGAASTPPPPTSMAIEKAVTQHFVQAPGAFLSKDFRRSADKLPTLVLAAFEVEQSGRELRVIDRDGSVYTGYLQEVVTGSTANSFAHSPSLALAPAASGKVKSAPITSKPQLVRQPSANYSFQVEGTNRSLGQRVVFTGNFSALSNTPLVNGLQNVPARAAGDSAGSNSGQPSEWRVFIQQILGKAIIGQDRTNEINAVPAK